MAHLSRLSVNSDGSESAPVSSLAKSFAVGTRADLRHSTVDQLVKEMVEADVEGVSGF